MWEWDGNIVCAFIQYGINTQLIISLYTSTVVLSEHDKSSENGLPYVQTNAYSMDCMLGLSTIQ